MAPRDTTVGRTPVSFVDVGTGRQAVPAGSSITRAIGHPLSDPAVTLQYRIRKTDRDGVLFQFVQEHRRKLGIRDE
jgi:hypothetical protein